jgi:inhibitor of cysteine peptidase
MQLTYEDSGSRRAVRVGDEIEVVLPENPTTGYRWHVEIDPEALRQANDHYKGATTPRGAPGIRVMTFQALRPGHALLRLVKRRAWEVQSSDEFEVHLDVAPMPI